MINILIDTRPLASNLTGVGRYTYEIAKNLNKNEFKPTYDYGFLTDELIVGNLNQQKNKPSIKSHLINIAKRILDKTPTIKKVVKKMLIKNSLREVKSINIDLYFQPNFIPLEFKAKVTVTTIHDLAFMSYPEFHPKERIDYFEQNFIPNLSKTDHFITVSNAIKHEIIKKLNISADKISVIYNGYDENIFKPKNKQTINILKDRLELNNPFILFVGSIEPRKNLTTLIQAYNELNLNNIDLVIVGAKGWENSEIHSLIQNNEHIKFLGFTPDDDLATLYSSATIFVYPSIYEGFGIPPLEAIACGAPILLSDIEVFREIYGNVAEFFSPLNAKELAEKLKNLINNSDKLSIMKKNGLILSKKYSWKKCIQEHEKLFIKLLD
ncbi:glycosyltransferase family 4 protein [Campylobacter fetus]